MEGEWGDQTDQTATAAVSAPKRVLRVRVGNTLCGSVRGPAAPRGGCWRCLLCLKGLGPAERDRERRGGIGGGGVGVEGGPYMMHVGCVYL